MNAYEVLGLTGDADVQQVHAAYRTRVKTCHPDLFVDHDRQMRAQEELVRLNLAYEEALRLSSQRQVGFHDVPVGQAIAFAQKLMEQGRYESALRQLGRAQTRSDEWYYLEGKVLMALRQYSSAHQAFREAVRRAPDDNDYRALALDAALEMKKHQKIGYRVIDWADGLLHPRKGSF